MNDLNLILCSDYVVSNYDNILKNYCVTISSGKIDSVIPYNPNFFPRGYEVFNFIGKHSIMTYGFSLMHTHLGLYPLRATLSMGLDLDRWVREYVWPWERKIRRNPVLSYYLAIIALKEIIPSGVTLIADMHPNGDKVAEALVEYGMRGNLSIPLMDYGIYNSGEEALQENIKLFNEWHNKHNLITVGFGPCTIRLASEETFRKSIEIAHKYKTNIHIHLSEVLEDVKFSLEKFGVRPAYYILNLGITKVRTLIAHGVWLEYNEIKALRNENITLVLNPRSNYLLRSGKPLISTIVKAVRTSLGVDVAPTCNIIDEINFMGVIEKSLNYNIMYKILTSGV
ncbi:MAG TPA: hypothetical protein EYP90_04065 [Chromatiaceae bacterium]|nr:hypothetical protein [Chromatiaceae bacterium]